MRVLKIRSGRAWRRIVLVGAALAAVFALPGQAGAGQVTALVPAYFYPSFAGSPWSQLNAAAGTIPIEAIMNPASGPGTFQNSDYVKAVDDLRSAGGKVIGYVSTGFGSRSFSDVTADIQAYLNWYNVDGFFLDEMGNNFGSLDYSAVYGFIKAIDAGFRVVGNAGIPFGQVEQYLAPATKASDTLVIFEGPLTNPDPFGASYEKFPDAGPYAGLNPWWLNYSSDQIAHLVYDTPTADAMRAALDKAVANNVGYVYFTDDSLVPDFNPWDTLPAYWDDEVAAIARINAVPEPSNLILALSGGVVGVAALARRRLRRRAG